MDLAQFAIELILIITDGVGILSHITKTVHRVHRHSSHAAYGSAGVVRSIVVKILRLLHFLPLRHDHLLSFVYDLSSILRAVNCSSLR